MPKPILLSVDDDSDVLRAIERDLRSKYGAEYRVIGSDSPEGALTLLKQLKVRNDSVALLLADQRMPHMDGVAFLQEGMRIFPEAKRALLTAYADTNAAISAINEANINYFFMKPWDPPAEHLYPQLDDLARRLARLLPSDFRRHPRPRHALVSQILRAARFSGPQSRPLSMDRRRKFRQRSGNETPAGSARPGRSRQPAGGPIPGRLEAPRKLFPRTSPKGRLAHARANQFLRSRDRRRRTRRSRRRGLRRLRRPAHGDDRARSARRTGRHEFAHRKLSRISHRPQRR